MNAPQDRSGRDKSGQNASAPLIVLAAGGTGGHMFPAEALAGILIARGFRVALITDLRGAAFGDALPAVPVYRIRASRLRRDFMDRIHSVVEMALGGLDARRLLHDLRPAVVVGFGGYPSMPTVVAAAMQKIPILLHEQNALLGRANRRLAVRARAVATSFETVQGLAEGLQAVVTGNPVRPGIRAAREQPYAAPAIDGSFSLLVTGGSQGARIFSEIVPAAAALLPAELKARLRIVQQCRPEDIDEVTEAYREAGIAAELAPFFNDMPRRLTECHLVIARSGASTVAELGVAGRPAILVPYPFAMDDHQTVNAVAFTAHGAGWVIAQRAFTAQDLAARLEQLMTNPACLAVAAQAALREGRADAAEKLAALAMSIAGSSPRKDPVQSGEAA